MGTGKVVKSPRRTTGKPAIILAGKSAQQTAGKSSRNMTGRLFKIVIFCL
jgi:hypothetical protein